MSKQDRQGVRSPTDLEQKYDLASIPGLKKAVKNSEEGLNKTNKTLEDFMLAALKSLSDLQNQIDGNITTWFYSGAPTLSNAPASDWNTEEEKEKHLGDLYYDKDSGYAYRFTLTDGEYSWLKLKDNEVTQALALANSAKDTADSKRRVFIEKPVPPYDNGDLWFQNQEIFICQFSKLENETYEDRDFVTATKYTDDTVATQVKGDLEEFMKNVEVNYSTTTEMNSAISKSEEAITASVEKKITENVDILQKQIDGAIETFTGSEEPTLLNVPASDWSTDEEKDKHIGDLYIVNSDGGDLSGFYYRFEKKETMDTSGNAIVTYQWVLLKDNEVTKALQDAKEANDKAAEIEANLEKNYSTTVEMQSEIRQTAEEINIEVGKKVGTDELVAKLNLSTGLIELLGNRIKIVSDNFKLNPDGTIEAVNGTFKGKIVSLEGNIGPWALSNIGIYNNTSKMGFLSGGAGLCEGVWYAGFTYEEMLRFAEDGSDMYPPIMITRDGFAAIKTLMIGDFKNGQPSYCYIWGDMDVSGGITAQTITPWSQAEKKKNFEEMQNALAILNEIDIYKFHYKTEADDAKKHIGFVIGDQYRYSKEVTSEDDTKADLYSLIGLCVKAVQELQTEVLELKEKLKEKEGK